MWLVRNELRVRRLYMPVRDLWTVNRWNSLVVQSHPSPMSLPIVTIRQLTSVLKRNCVFITSPNITIVEDVITSVVNQKIKIYLHYSSNCAISSFGTFRKRQGVSAWRFRSTSDPGRLSSKCLHISRGLGLEKLGPPHTFNLYKMLQCVNLISVDNC